MGNKTSKESSSALTKAKRAKLKAKASKAFRDGIKEQKRLRGDNGGNRSRGSSSGSVQTRSNRAREDDAKRAAGAVLAATTSLANVEDAPAVSASVTSVTMAHTVSSDDVTSGGSASVFACGRRRR